MELIRRHLTVASTITDEFTDGHILSVFHTLTDNLPMVIFRQSITIYRRNKNPSVYFKQESFFLARKFCL
jgi:hypothetical protein